jgi:glutathione S-transferase
MKLYLNKTSPYARLVLATAIETGVADRLSLEWVDPWQDDPALLAVNPLAKVPALMTDDGTILIESHCICDYLLHLSTRDDLLPVALAARSDTMQRVGLARAVIDCAFGAVIQRRFNQNADTALSQRWLAALPRAAIALDALCSARLTTAPDFGDLTIAVAWSYCDFRLPEVAWRDKAPHLAALVDKIALLPALQSTLPE